MFISRRGYRRKIGDCRQVCKTNIKEKILKHQNIQRISKIFLELESIFPIQAISYSQ